MSSRPKRWANALANAQTAVEELEGAFNELQELKDEYQDWQDNLPENLQQSALGEKLEAISCLEFEHSIDEVKGQIDEAEACELPLGFGRD